MNGPILILDSCWQFGSNMWQDSSITVAFDDIPDEGLNSPLRLEKVANEVFVQFMYCSLACLKLHVSCIVKFDYAMHTRQTRSCVLILHEKHNDNICMWLYMAFLLFSYYNNTAFPVSLKRSVSKISLHMYDIYGIVVRLYLVTKIKKHLCCISRWLIVGWKRP